jgi:hypothetical protein
MEDGNDAESPDRARGRRRPRSAGGKENEDDDDHNHDQEDNDHQHHENKCDITVFPKFSRNIQTPAAGFDLLKKARGFQIVSVILSSLALDRERAD